MKSILSICVLALILSACSTSQTKRDPDCIDLPGLTGSNFCVILGPSNGGQNGKKALYPRRNNSTFTYG